MTVLWEGPDAEASAAAMLARSRRHKEQRAQPRQCCSAANVTLVASGVLSWLFFFAPILLLTCAPEGDEDFVWGLIGTCGCLAVLLAGIGSAMGRSSLVLFGLWSLVSVGLGMVGGIYLDAEYMQTYWKLSAGKPVIGVDPQSNASTTDGAAVIGFVNGTFVDDMRTVGFVAGGHIYCVAPVARQGAPTARIEYWATGVDCCEQRGSFDCGASRDRGPEAPAAVSYKTDGDELFLKAIRTAASVYGIQSAAHARRVSFVGDPAQVQDDLLDGALAATLTALALHAFGTVAIAAAVTRASPVWDAALLGRMPLQPAELEEGMRGEAEAEQAGTSRFLLRGGGQAPRTPGIARERSCCGLGYRELWTFGACCDDAEIEASEHEIWQDQVSRMDSGRGPVFFETTTIAVDGGFQEVPELVQNMGWLRYISAASTPTCLILNFALILKSDLKFLWGPSYEPRKFLLSSWFLTLVLEPVAALFGRSGRLDLDPLSYVAKAEILGLVLFSAYTVGLLVEAAASPPQGRRRWRNVYRIFWNILPLFTTYSAMGLLYFVTPSVLLMQANNLYTRATTHRQLQLIDVYNVLSFVSSRLLFLSIGFDAFLVKFRMTSEYIGREELSVTNLLHAATFVIQLLGVVQVSAVLQERVFMVFFGGEDGVVEKREKACERTYNALLAREMYAHSSSALEFSVAMLSFTDADVQRLVMNKHVRRSLEGGDPQTMSPPAKPAPHAVSFTKPAKLNLPQRSTQPEAPSSEPKLTEL